MRSDMALELMNQLLWNALVVSAPVLAGAMLVGLLISVLQVATQIQEMTLAFVPKIMAIFAALLIFLPLMGALLAGFANEVFARIAEF